MAAGAQFSGFIVQLGRLGCISWLLGAPQNALLGSEPRAF